MRAWNYWGGLRALSRMGQHERWRVAMMSDPDLSGEIYCHCRRCERDRIRWMGELPDQETLARPKQRVICLTCMDEGVDCPFCGRTANGDYLQQAPEPPSGA